MEPKGVKKAHFGPVLEVRQDGRWNTPKDQEWVCLELTIDSGACDHVMGTAPLPGLPMKQTPQVGIPYVVANGEDIPNLGEKMIHGYTAEGHGLDIVLQIAAVHKALASVRKMCQAGNQVVFDAEGGYVLHKGSGLRTKIHKRNGTYVMDLWVLQPMAKAGAMDAMGGELKGQPFR